MHFNEIQTFFKKLFNAEKPGVEHSMLQMTYSFWILLKKVLILILIEKSFCFNLQNCRLKTALFLVESKSQLI